MVIAMLLVMVSVVICERVAPEMLYQGIGYGGRALVIATDTTRSRHL